MIYTVTLNPAIDREYTVPALEFDTVLRATVVRDDPGGKGFNVSRMIKILGGESIAFGFVAGSSGEWLESQLNGSGIRTNFVWVDGETRTNTTVVTPEGESHLKVNGPGAAVSQKAQEELLQQVSQYAQPDDWWVLAGSLPPGVPADFCGLLIDTITRSGGHILLDTSGEPLRAGAQHRPHWIKPNLNEALALTNCADQTCIAQVLLGQNVQALISLGKEGALLVNGGNVTHMAPVKIEEKNPIGAGDAMVGGFVWGLSKRMSVQAACCWGMACGATAASLPGTDFGTKELVEHHYEAMVQQILP